MKYTHLCWENCGKIESHQLGLQYLSHYRLSNGFDSNWKEVWSQSDANGICPGAEPPYALWGGGHGPSKFF